MHTFDALPEYSDLGPRYRVLFGPPLILSSIPSLSQPSPTVNPIPSPLVSLILSTSLISPYLLLPSLPLHI